MATVSPGTILCRPKILVFNISRVKYVIIPVNIEEFIINIPAAENITHALNLLNGAYKLL